MQKRLFCRKALQKRLFCGAGFAKVTFLWGGICKSDFSVALGLQKRLVWKQGGKDDSFWEGCHVRKSC